MLRTEHRHLIPHVLSHSNFSNYKARFSMPGGGKDNLFYSFDMGPVHFIGFSTEVYYFLQLGLKSLVFQYKWLEEDLRLASLPENRAKRPWIVTFGHRPMYCSNDNGDDCSHHNTVVRQGLPILGGFGLEELFYRYGVDVEIWAHEHCYERTWPIYNYTVFNGSASAPYHNPKAPVHIITGAAGNKEGREPFFKNIPKWSAFHSQVTFHLKIHLSLLLMVYLFRTLVTPALKFLMKHTYISNRCLTTKTEKLSIEFGL